MAYRLTWAPMARQDLRELIAYIAQDSRSVAAKFARGVFHAIERLPEFPESGRMVPEFEDPVIREVIRKPCRVVYRVDSKHEKIEIARVWHAARGVPQL